MKIALTHHQYRRSGGMETYLLDLLTGLCEDQDEVTVLVYKLAKSSEKPLGKIILKNLDWLPRSLRKYWFGMTSHRVREIKAQDIKMTLMRALYHDVIVCGGTHLGYINHTQKTLGIRDRVEIAFEQKSYDSSKLIIAHSKLVKEELITFYGIDPQKILLAYPPVNISKFNQALRDNREALRRQFKLHQHKTSILFPSTGHKRKGFFHLVEAMQSLPQDEFELVVAGSKPITTRYQAINYVGFVENMAALYVACDVTLLPSLYEPFGLVVTESLQCGTPVIVSKFVGAKELITAKEGLILDNITPSAIARALTHFKQQTFTVAPNFAERNNLTISGHIGLIKKQLQVLINKR